MDLLELRREIDRIDSELVAVSCRRMVIFCTDCRL